MIELGDGDIKTVMTVFFLMFKKLEGRKWRKKISELELEVLTTKTI